MFLIGLVRALTALAFLIGQKGLAFVGPLYFVGWRMTIAGTLLLVLIYLWQNRAFKLHRTDIGSFAKVAVFQMYLAFIAEFWALQYLSTPKIALLFNFIPFFTAILAYFMLRERLTGQQILGLIVSFSGFLTVFISSPANATSLTAYFSLGGPEIVVLLAAMSTAYAWIATQKLITVRAYHPVFVNGVTMLTGGLLALITALLVEPWPTLTTAQFSYTVRWMGALILVSNLICYPLYSWLLQRYSATLLALTSLTMPLFAAGWEWLFWDRQQPLSFYISLLIVSAGLILFYLGESQRLARLTAQETNLEN